ncbi:MAG TPA: response regulator transcription factor [Candidatus Babeliaceae bacterium]|nr:response regulator transcription factor [Candidatus Babeliaceae bacterium]
MTYFYEMKDNIIINIAVVDDHTLMREVLVKQISTDHRLKVIIEASNGADMLQQLLHTNVLPDVAIVDLKMPVMDGFNLTDEIKKNYPQISILILSGYGSEYNIAAMISKGINGYLLKDCSEDEFIKAIYSIYETGYYYSELADRRMFNVFQRANPKSINIPEREMELLKYCATSLNYDEIAPKMGISLKTLDGCRERLFNRLGVTTRTAAVVFAMNSGITVKEGYKSDNLKIKY